MVASQDVSEPDASSPAAFVFPGGHAVQTFVTTRWSTVQTVAPQYVLNPEASSPALVVFPAGQAEQTLFTTRSSTAHNVLSH
jgi:hypothetical protein